MISGKLWSHDIGIKMYQKEVKNIYDDFKLKKSFGLHGLYKIISALCGLN